MARIEIAPFKTVAVPTSGKYLTIISATAQFEIYSPEAGTLIGNARRFEVGTISEVFFRNESDNTILVEYETANITASNSSSVSVTNTPTIQRIIEPIAVTASATVEDGRMRLIKPDVLNELEQVTILPNETKKFIAARDATSRKVTLFVQSEQYTVLRVGGSAALSATQGGVLSGSVDVVGSTTIENTSAIWLLNTSDTTAIVTGYEEYRL